MPTQGKPLGCRSQPEDPYFSLSTALTVGSTVTVFKGQKKPLGLGILAQVTQGSQSQNQAWIWTPEALVCTLPQGNGYFLSKARPRTGL